MPPRPHPARDLREACVDQALAIIGDVGVEALSIREVARRLGVSHQAPYKHFASSDHLLAEVVRRTYRQFSEHLEARPRSSHPGEDLKSMGEAYFRFALDHPLHYRLLFGTPLPDPAAHPEMMAEARRAFQLLHEAIGHLKPPAAEEELQLDALFVWATVHGLASILQTAALDQIGLDKVVLAEALPHALHRIGKALAP
jgi:AcrR family transcriptional regulator